MRQSIKKVNQKEETLLPSDPELCCGMFCYSEWVTERVSKASWKLQEDNTGAAVKSWDNSFPEDSLCLSLGKDTGQSGPWLEPVWQVFRSWASTHRQYSRAGKGLGSSIQTLWPGVLRDCLWQGSEIQAEQEGITDTSNCSCREHLSWTEDSEGKCSIWCRAPRSEIQHVLSSPQHDTLKQKLQVFKVQSCSSNSRTEIPNVWHKIYPASTTISSLEKTHSLMINGPQTL